MGLNRNVIAVLLAGCILLTACGQGRPGAPGDYATIHSESTQIRIADLPGGVHGLAMLADGSFIYSDSYARQAAVPQVWRVDAQGHLRSTGIIGRIPSGLRMQGTSIVVCDAGADVVRIFDSSHVLQQSYAVPSPWNVAVMPDQSLVAVSYAGAVFRMTEAGVAEQLFAGLDAPFDIAATSDGNFWISEQGTDGPGRVTLRSPDGQILETLGPLDNPEGLVLTVGGSLWIADTGAGIVYFWDVEQDRLTAVTDDLHLPIAGTALPGGSVAFNALHQGRYGIFQLSRTW